MLNACGASGTAARPDELLAHISSAHSENINFFDVITVDVEAELAKLGPPAGGRCVPPHPTRPCCRDRCDRFMREFSRSCPSDGPRPGGRVRPWPPRPAQRPEFTRARRQPCKPATPRCSGSLTGGAARPRTS